jgi:hypothetical protein
VREMERVSIPTAIPLRGRYSCLILFCNYSHITSILQQLSSQQARIGP